jgi:hypothetical protein
MPAITVEKRTTKKLERFSQLAQAARRSKSVTKAPKNPLKMYLIILLCRVKSTA